MRQGVSTPSRASETCRSDQRCLKHDSRPLRVQLASGLSFAGAQRASSRFLAGSDPRPAVRRAQEAVAERGVREALRTSRTYVTGLWARLNGQQPPGQSALPFGMLPPVSNAGAPVAAARAVASWRCGGRACC